MKIEKLKSKTTKELVAEYESKKNKLFAYQLDLKSGKEKDSSKVKIMKRDIARILTLININKTIKEVLSTEAVKEAEVKEESK